MKQGYKNNYLLIVDGSSLLATSYYSSLPKAIRKEKDEDRKKELYEKLLRKDGEGRYVNAVELFFHTLFTIMTFQRPSHLVICWDLTRNTFRKELWQPYKANRSETPAPLKEQFETAYEICKRIGIVQFRDPMYEADDFAGSLCRSMEKHMPVRILTRDKDYFQLITDQTRIWYGMSDLEKVKEWRRKYHMVSCLPSRVVEIDQEVLREEFGYSPESVPMIKALYGDPTDNIPGVSGMGEFRSMKLAEHYHSPKDLYEAIDSATSLAKRKKLNRIWKEWGIQKSPYVCLVKKESEKRQSARQMAELCFRLGKICTDIDLSHYSENQFRPRNLRFRVSSEEVHKIMNEYCLRLSIGNKRRPAFFQNLDESKNKAAKNRDRRNSGMAGSGRSADNKKNENGKSDFESVLTAQNRTTGSRKGKNRRPVQKELRSVQAPVSKSTDPAASEAYLQKKSEINQSQTGSKPVPDLSESKQKPSKKACRKKFRRKKASSADFKVHSNLSVNKDPVPEKREAASKEKHRPASQMKSRLSATGKNEPGSRKDAVSGKLNNQNRNAKKKPDRRVNVSANRQPDPACASKSGSGKKNMRRKPSSKQKRPVSNSASSAVQIPAC